MTGRIQRIGFVLICILIVGVGIKSCADKDVGNIADPKGETLDPRVELPEFSQELIIDLPEGQSLDEQTEIPIFPQEQIIELPQEQTIEEQEQLPEKYVAPAEASICLNSADCETLGEISVGHGGAVATLQSNPNLQDPIAIWARQLGGIVTCVEDGGTMRVCVDQSDATELCKSNFLELSNINNGSDAAAFDAVFLGGTGPCAPEGGLK